MHIVLCYIEHDNKILTIKRCNEPYRGYYALLGGKIEVGEDAAHAAIRETSEESGLKALSADLIIESSEVVIDETTGDVLYSYDMSLVNIQVEIGEVQGGCEGELCWIEIDEFLGSESVVPTDIDLVKRYIISGSCSKVHYSVVRNFDGLYRISTIN